MEQDKKIKVLIVDDEINMRRCLSRGFAEKDQFIIEEAGDGIEALEKVAKDKPDIIILDGRMPRLDGIETCKRLKQNPQTRDILIIFSTGTHAKDVKEGRIPADDYVIKPYEFSQLYEKIKQLRK